MAPDAYLKASGKVFISGPPPPCALCVLHSYNRHGALSLATTCKDRHVCVCTEIAVFFLSMDLHPDICDQFVLLLVTVTVLSRWGTPENLLVSEFSSNQDLFEACLASSSIPFLTEPGLGARFRGRRVFDGGITNNTAVA